MVTVKKFVLGADGKASIVPFNSITEENQTDVLPIRVAAASEMNNEINAFHKPGSIDAFHEQINVDSNTTAIRSL